MQSGKKRVVIVNIDDSYTPTTGDRVKYVSSGKKLSCWVDLVGIQTQQLGQAQGISLSFAIEIPRIQYNYEKYCYFNNQLFEVAALSKARLANNMLLNVKKIKDEKIETAINNWLNGVSV